MPAVRLRAPQSPLPSPPRSDLMSSTARSSIPCDYNLLAPGLFLDPHPVFNRMPRESPVHYSPELDSWVLTTYEDVCAGLRDPRLSVVEELKRLAKLSAADQLALQPLKRIFVAWGNRAEPELH